MSKAFIMIFLISLLTISTVLAEEKRQLQCEQKLVQTEQRVLELQSQLLQLRHMAKNRELTTIQNKLKAITEQEEKTKKEEKENGK